jgi:quercetin dioxygenase-like cupin family protein/uncharacterized protein YgiM (DUF1202 family)
MQRVASVLEPQKSLLGRFSGPLVTCVIGASLLLAPAAQAQDSTPVASPAAEAATPAAEQDPAVINQLFSYDLEAFPTAPVSIRLLRITLAPGASSPMHTHPGPEFDLVESGTLTVTSEGDADVVRAGAEPVTGPLDGEELGEGDLVVFPPHSGMNLQNTSDEDVVLLSAVFHPVSEDVPSTRYTDGNPAPDAFDGVSFQVLGDGIAQTFPAGPATIALETVDVPAESTLPGFDGAALYSLANGSFAFSVGEGDVQVSRTDSPGLRPNAAPEQEFTLSAGDAAFFPSGVSDTPRDGQTDPLSVLRLSALPSESISAGPAAITFQSPEAAESDDDADDATQETFTEIAVGAPVVTNTDTVNLRAEPSVEGEVVEQLDEGTELTVIGGPEDADDYTWWQVSIDGTDGPTEGWVAADFIALVGATEDEEPTDAATPSASPEASPSASPVASEYEVGDIVVLNTDNVRIRDEASTEGEPIDAFSTGEEFEITGEPVEADDYTWYPVTMVDDDSISGWIASDFFEPADEDEEE